MSGSFQDEALTEACDTVIKDLIANSGGITTGYFILVKYLDADGNPMWLCGAPDGQTDDVTLGILRFATLVHETETTSRLRHMLGDDDN